MFELVNIGHLLKMPVMRKLSILICFVLLAVIRLQGQLLTVYPGDASNSRLCNHVDLLYIGQNYGAIGPARNALPNIGWTAQQVQPWGGPAFVDPGYSDCEGTGSIDRFDLDAITQNFGLVIPGSNPIPDPSSLAAVGAPPLVVQISQDTINVLGTINFNVQLNLGSSTNPVDSIYGFAFTIDYDTSIVDQISLFIPPSSFALDSTSLTFVRIDTLLGKIYGAGTCIDHSNRTGFGTIATIGIVMDDDIRVSSQFVLQFVPSYFYALTSSGAVVDAHAERDSVIIITGTAPTVLSGIDIYPNPAHDRLSIKSMENPLTGLRLYGIDGRLHYQAQNLNSNFETLNTSQLNAGCYFLELQSGSRFLRRKVAIQ
jgi:hypothetical protein